MSPTEFKAYVLSCARELMEQQPQGFSFADIYKVISCEAVDKKGDSTRRLRNCLSRLCKSGALVSFERGRYRLGFLDYDSEALGAGVALVGELERVFYMAGGFIRIADLLREVGREDDSRARLVRRFLKTGPDYASDLPFDGYRTVWRLIDPKRRRIPLPGRWLALELRLTVAGSAQGRIPHSWGILEHLMALRRRICRGLQDARMLSGMSVHALLEDSCVRTSFANAVLAGTRPPASNTTLPATEWWNRLVSECGLELALEEAWRSIETEEQILLVDAFDTRFWVSVGCALGIDPACLSRGAVTVAAAHELAKVFKYAWPDGPPLPAESLEKRANFAHLENQIFR